jgi:hypothetical protein
VGESIDSEILVKQNGDQELHKETFLNVISSKQLPSEKVRRKM